MQEYTKMHMAGFLDKYLRSDKTALNECYKTHSIWKEKAYDYCLDMMVKYNGRDPRIVSYNCCVFTFGFLGVVNGREAFILITKDYDKFVFLD